MGRVEPWELKQMSGVTGLKRVKHEEDKNAWNESRNRIAARGDNVCRPMNSWPLIMVCYLEMKALITREFRSETQCLDTAACARGALRKKTISSWLCSRTALEPWWDCFLKACNWSISIQQTWNSSSWGDMPLKNQFGFGSGYYPCHVWQFCEEFYVWIWTWLYRAIHVGADHFPLNTQEVRETRQLTGPVKLIA